MRTGQQRCRSREIPGLPRQYIPEALPVIRPFVLATLHKVMWPSLYVRLAQQRSLN